MSNQPTHPLKFKCFKCKKSSIYPNYLKEGESPNEAKIVVKRCTTCGIENTIEVPEGWSMASTDSVLRGFEP